MKRSVITLSSIFIGLAVTATAFGQTASCEFDLVGAWEAATADPADKSLYRFGPDFSFTVSRAGSEQREIASAVYSLDDPKTPKLISFKAGKEGEDLPQAMPTSMQITGYDDSSLTFVEPGVSAPIRWIKLDPNRYFIVLAARNGVFYDRSGPAFPMLIKRAGARSQIDAVGTYAVKGERAFGTVPQQAYDEFMQEPRDDESVMLRLEINSAQYARALKILHTWERRVQEDALLYEEGSRLNNVLLVKAVVESLNQCAESINMYKLDYLYDNDWIANKYEALFVPFYYFKELQRLNAALHVRDAQFTNLGRRKTGASRHSVAEAGAAKESK